MRYFFYTILIVLLVLSAASAVTQVQPGELGVVKRFGRILPEHWEPGVHVGLPWGMDTVYRVPFGRVKRVSVGFVGKDEEDNATPAGQLLTGDHNLVNVQAEIYFTIRKDQVTQYIVHEERVDGLVARAAEGVLAEWVAGRTVDHVLLREREKIPLMEELPVWLKKHVQQRIAGYGLGVQIEQASITKLYPPDEVKAAFDKVAQAETAIRTKTYQAQQAADSKERDAKAEEYRLLRLAAAYAKEQTLQAQGEAETFAKRLYQFQQLRKLNPDYLNALWLDEMTRLFARMRESGRIDVLDHYLSGDTINITQFPLMPKKK